MAAIGWLFRGRAMRYENRKSKKSGLGGGGEGLNVAAEGIYRNAKDRGTP